MLGHAAVLHHEREEEEEIYISRGDFFFFKEGGGGILKRGPVGEESTGLAADPAPTRFTASQSGGSAPFERCQEKKRGGGEAKMMNVLLESMCSGCSLWKQRRCST